MTAAKPMQQAAIFRYAKRLHLPTLRDQFVSLACFIHEHIVNGLWGGTRWAKMQTAG